MSYILEALKKAQAERQLGSAPTIHAPAQSYPTPAAGEGGKHRYVALAVGCGVLLAGVALWWLRQDGGQLRSAPTVVVAQAPLSTLPAPVVSAPAPAPVSAPAPVPALVPVPVPVPVPAPVPVPVPAPVAKQVAPSRPVPVQESAPAARRAAAPAQVREAPAPARVAAGPLAAVAPAPEDSVRTLQQLPEAIQREIPKVVFGGYIYSPDPAERLLLVDKMLRREGEEVAPGLVLERLLPKAAVMNYRGTRYRVGY